MEKIIFGPVPSRRLGQSLGINNIPPKVCSYSCVYCQLGRTFELKVDRSAYYQPERIATEIEERIRLATNKNQKIDYLTFVPDGEPTLDLNLGRTIGFLKRFGLKIAVITNSSLLWDKAVRRELALADWVSIKIDSLQPETWKKINRPRGRLSLEMITKGILAFAQSYKGELATETMLVNGVNDTAAEIEKVAAFIKKLKPLLKMSYLSIPTRPPAEKWVKPATEERLNLAYQILTEKSIPVELLTGYEGNLFGFTGKVEDDLLSITSVHPMREEAVQKLLNQAGARWEQVESLLQSGRLIEIEYQGNKFYLRKLKQI
jgi:wyosine [tRNA(Phe)-imidazoG37] synthetase (radical SAM superfamily)